jgi:hypothetical protein
MSFLAGIPLIGSALASLFDGADKLFTSDEERLKFQHAILMAFQPVILVLVQAQAEFDKVRAQIELAAMQSGDRFVRWTRPAMTWLTFGFWAYCVITGNPQAEYAFYAFGIVGGLFSATRGGEKIVGQWMNGRNGKAA